MYGDGQRNGSPASRRARSRSQHHVRRLFRRNYRLGHRHSHRRHLAHNQLTGTIPTELGNLTGLDQFNLSGNQLTGTIPTTFGNLVAMTELYLGDNQLSGPVPASLLDLDMTLLVATFGPNGCLTANGNAALITFLDSYDPTWDDACP